LPDKYQSLVVNYWGSDQASKDDLSSSVEAIKNKSENFNYIYHSNSYIQGNDNMLLTQLSQYLIIYFNVSKSNIYLYNIT
jgi:hypothetical protein